ncbi:hypothetical protein ACOMHN_058945 [Nucella lapillus]
MDGAPSQAVRCGSCGGDPEAAILMTCLHVLCRNCLPSPASGSRSNHEVSYHCPVCVPATTTTSQAKNTSHNGMTSTVTSRIASRPSVSVEELRRRCENHQSSSDHHCENGDEEEEENEDDEEENEDSTNGADGGESFSSSLTFPCPQHRHREAEHFCSSCHQMACSKCHTSYHRKCSQHLLTLAEAVTWQQPALNSLHAKLAQRVVTSQENLHQEQKRLKNLKEQRSTLVGEIRAQKEALVRALEVKEQRLIEEVNDALDAEKGQAEGRVEHNQRSARAAEGQLGVLEAVMSVKGEPEILPLLPSLHSRLDAETADDATSDKETSLHLVFNVNRQLADEVEKADLGQITPADKSEKGDNKGDESDLRLTLMTSFHAQSREDTCDPLLTDVLLLPAGDVIVTDRDNKCVKKFNSTGHLLTRVPIPEVPSRLALVSHGKAVVSVMRRKILFFLSLLGTVRILSSVRVKKHYCFLAAAGQGQGQGQGGESQLLAATNMCDVIDLISESGVLLRRLFTHRGERVSISRPLYLHVPLNPRDPEVAALVVDSGRRMLFALTSEGETAFTFRPKDAERSLECPLGVGTVPRRAGASAGTGGLILLADRDRHRVVLLGRRGAWLRELLGEKESLHKPCALYTAQPGRVALTQVDGWVKIYKVE